MPGESAFFLSRADSSLRLERHGLDGVLFSNGRFVYGWMGVKSYVSEPMNMFWYQFAIRLVMAFVLGALVGVERQWRQRQAGLRTNCLVSVGAAMFVMMGGLIGGADGSQGRVAAYVVSGIGFLGGGVILKEGFSIRGLNTAATLWCTAAIGTLAGLGHAGFAFLGTLAVLSANLLLRPLANRINRTPLQPAEEIVLYVFECVCRASDEGHIRALLLQNIGSMALLLSSLHSEDEEPSNRVKVKARLKSMGRKDELLERIVTRLSLEPTVTSIRWEILASTSESDEDAASSTPIDTIET